MRVARLMVGLVVGLLKPWALEAKSTIALEVRRLVCSVVVGGWWWWW